MTKKFLFMSLLGLTAMSAVAQDMGQTIDSTVHQKLVSDEQLLTPLKPTYLRNVSEAASWGKNWFIEIKGGASAFLGKPIGCGDVFDRLTPALQVGVGKWLTPAVGGRLSYQGLSFKNAEFNKMDYHFIHADFMYNLTAFVNQNALGLSRWDVIPYVGVGMIHNTDWPTNCEDEDKSCGSNPFSFSYGLEARYRLNNRMHLVAELSGMTTSKKFDGIGTSTKFGDNMLTLSAGLSFTLGKVGYTRIADARPYMVQNDWLLEYANGLQNRNRTLVKQLHEDERLLAEYNKILEIEGLLDYYGKRLQSKDKSKSLFPKNDYSGLNSLRARLSNRAWDGNAENLPKAMKKRGEGMDKDAENGLRENFLHNGNEAFDEYVMAMLNGEEPIGAPVYFFFNLNTSELTEVSQFLNIDEIAKAARTYSLKVKVIGAADSATGSEERNQQLSQERANYIRQLLIERNVSDSNVTTEYEGGIDNYSPVQANRNTCVILSF